MPPESVDRSVNVAKPVLGEEAFENVKKVLESGHLVQGQLVKDFESEWARQIGVDYAIAVNSGTAALHLALLAHGLEPGEEVIVPSLTFGSTATAVVHAGGVPVFADIERDIYTLDPTDIERCITPETEAIIPVHLYGHPAEMDEILTIADNHDLTVIEDAAQAHGAQYKGQPVGGIGEIGCFSFYATKNITTGEGGIVTTNDDEIATKLRLMRNHGLKNRDTHVQLGYNFRMSELNAAIGIEQIGRLDEFNKKRQRLSNRLFEHLDDLDWLSPSTVRNHVEHAFFWAPFEVDSDLLGLTGKQVWKNLKDRGVETRHRYNRPLYDQPVFEDHLGFNSKFPWSENPNDHDYDLELPTVEAVVGNMIGLPNHPEMTDEDIEYVVKTVREFGHDHRT